MNQDVTLNYTTSISFHILSSSLFNIHPIIKSHTTGVTTKHYATGVALQFDCKIVFRQLTCTGGRHEGEFLKKKDLQKKGEPLLPETNVL